MTGIIILSLFGLVVVAVIVDVILQNRRERRISAAWRVENDALMKRALAERDERLRRLGFEEPTPEQRKANLALLRWPQ